MTNWLKSRASAVESCAPQGTVLAPLLFLSLDFDEKAKYSFDVIGRAGSRNTVNISAEDTSPCFLPFWWCFPFIPIELAF